MDDHLRLKVLAQLDRIKLERAALLDLTRSLQLESRVHWLGHRDDIGDVLSSFDIYAVSSDQEGLSIAMVEAMCMRTLPRSQSRKLLSCAERRS